MVDLLAWGSRQCGLDVHRPVVGEAYSRDGLGVIRLRPAPKGAALVGLRRFIDDPLDFFEN